MYQVSSVVKHWSVVSMQLFNFDTLFSRTDFVITASQDGHVKYWKKQEDGIEFVKHYRAHLGMCLSV